MSDHSNIFLIINLGSEMLYVIDQRLKAQEIGTDKSTQVLRDLIGVLLNPKLLHQLSTQKTVQSTQNAYSLLSDIACSSIMRLDSHSMGKLWDLMIMVFKWQLTLTDELQVIDITCKHLTGVAKLLPQEDIMLLTQYAGDYLCKIWSKLTPAQINELRLDMLLFLQNFRVKVSLLLRLNLQNNDGSFVMNPSREKFGKILNNLGENVYLKYNNINQPVSDLKTKEFFTSDSDCTDLKLLANELLGESKFTDQKKPAIMLNFDDIKESQETNEAVHHTFINKTVDMENLNVIYGEMSIDKQTDSNPTLQEQLLNMLGSDED